VFEDPIVQLGGIAVLAFAVTWFGDRIRIPVILPLLITGFLVGPMFGLVNPDDLIGDLLTPAVSIAVGLILFEGGLSLKVREMAGQQRVLWMLVTVGMLITWAVGAATAVAFTDLPPGLAVLLGSILVVSGPTVVGPLLSHVRPKRSVGSILKWESIFIDPIGALVAVLAFEVFLVGRVGASPIEIASQVAQFIAAGVVVGGVVAAISIPALRRHWVPEHLLSLFGISVALLAFIVADSLVAESGLLSTTVLGLFLANHKTIRTEQIVQFSEVVRVLLIGVLFIVLSARLTADQLRVDLGAAAAIVVALVFVARPLAVAISTWRSRLTWRERVLLAAVAPRGIVAASIASVFALELQREGTPGAQELIPLVFAVIVATVTIYGLGMGPLARWLGLAERHQEGLLILGAGKVERVLADALAEAGVDVVLATTNRDDYYDARAAGRRIYFGNILARDVDFELDLSGIGRLLALTPNDDINTIAAGRYRATFGGGSTYQLVPRRRDSSVASIPASDFGGRLLFGPEWDYTTVLNSLENGGRVRRATGLDADDMAETALSAPGETLLFVVKADGRVLIAESGGGGLLTGIAQDDVVISLAP
jgi:NhaP-type Na+/H+ or K+/H+ antiporter